jgi:RNA polymerase sigma factor (TIGR02999 family)
MNHLTRKPEAARSDAAKAAEDLLPMVYDELRRLATAKLAGERPGQTLQPTALVHEAWLRLAGDSAVRWNGRSHFFAAAAEAMRRILVERARRRKVREKGGFAKREDELDSQLPDRAPTDQLLAVHEALDGLAREDATAAELVKLRYFVGMSMTDAAAALELPLRSAERLWSFARAWLREQLRE